MTMLARRSTTVLCAIVALLAAVASGAGVFLRGDLATRTFETVRGEHVDMLVGGVYRFNGEAIAAEGVGWDLVTLFVVVPALVLTLPALWRGSLRGRLLALGLLAYFLYQYFEYANALAYGPLFPVYVGITAASASALAVLVASLDVRSLPAQVSDAFPRRGVTAFGLYMALLLGGMWLPLIAQTMTADVVESLDGGTTLVVQAFDLGFLVPLGLLTAIAAWRRLPAGYVLASVVAVKGAAMGLAIAVMLVVEAMVTGELAVPPIVVFALTALAAVVLGWRVLASVTPAVTTTVGPTAATPAAAAAAPGTSSPT